MKESNDGSFFMCWTSFWMSFFPFLFILHVGCKTPSPGEIYGSRGYVLIREHHWIVFSSQIFILGSFSIHFFYFPYLFIHISIFTNPKNEISTIDQGFWIFARSLEALVRFISSPCSFSSFHRSFSVSKSKNTPKNSFWFQSFNLTLHGFDVDSYFSNLKIRFWRVEYKFVWYVILLIQRPHFYTYQNEIRWNK